MRALIVAAVGAALCGCGSGQPLTGPAPASFSTETLGLCPLACLGGASTQVTSTQRVTAGHESFLIAAETHHLKVADLTWFRRDGEVPTIRAPIIGEPVTIYGNSDVFGAAQASGWVVTDRGFIERSGHKDWGIIVAADVGHGFSGGGVYGKDGALLGVLTDSMRVTTGQYAGSAAFAYRADEIKEEINMEGLSKNQGMR